MQKDLSFPIQYLKGVGPKKAVLLSRIDINTIKDILYYLPFRYEDRSSIEKIATLKHNEINVVIGKIIKINIISPYKKSNLKILEVIITDGSGILRAKWFNQPYLKQIFKQGLEVIFCGVVKLDYRGTGFEIINPEYEILDNTDNEDPQTSLLIHTGRIVPIYKLTEGLGQKQLRNIVYLAINEASAFVEDNMPQEIIKQYNFPDLKESILNIHFPAPSVSIDEFNRGVSTYHQRLAFDELFIFQLGLAAIKKTATKESGILFNPTHNLTNKLLKQLPFELTNAQKRVFNEILKDMQLPVQMNRLIQGDVGCGKTVIALLSMLVAVECGYQAALMAPTEILAEQHYLNIISMVEGIDLKVSLLTSSVKKDTDSNMYNDSDIIIGTHVLIQDKISFKKLGLIIIDEQHRFGVMQRTSLRKKGISPDTLIMTATPIPRTLALTLYGDTDYSTIDELPPNRTSIITKLVYSKQKNIIYDLIISETNKNNQVYVVYPTIEETDKTTLQSAIKGLKELQEIFPQLKIAIIHGRIKPSERENIMKDFKNGLIHILVATTVVEVGVDIPNATIMIIEHAERFGLSQLHQLRGRVGRSKEQSFCILLVYNYNEDSKKRLSVMVKTTDGFKIAEEDLNIRGPGEFFGVKQSGMPDLKVANLIRDVKILEKARKDAFNLIERDFLLLSYPKLKKQVQDYWGEKIELFMTK